MQFNAINRVGDGIFRRCRAPLIVFAALVSLQPAVAQIGCVEDPDAEAAVTAAYDNLQTVEEKVGQLLMVGWTGCGLDQTLRTLITDYHAGSVIVFEYNIPGLRSYCADPRIDPAKADPVEVPENAAKLANAIQDVAFGTSPQIPVLIAADQEQGRTLILEKGATRFPSAMAIGATRNEDLAYRAGLVTGREMRAVGMHMNLAPVADIHRNTANDIISDRSFGGSREIVTKLATQFMRGLHAGGVLATAKHFPGHGDSSVDPHDGLPVVRFIRQEVENNIMAPFRALVDEGVDAVMPAHMHFPELEARRRPVTFSKAILDRYVRGSRAQMGLGFDGVVITDDLVVMKAAHLAGADGTELPMERVVEAAAEAGNDIFMLRDISGGRHDNRFDLDEDFAKVFDTLVWHYTDNRDQLEASVKRVLRMKRRVHCSFAKEDWIVDVDRVSSTLRRKEHLDLAREAAAESITLVNDRFRLFGEGRAPLSSIAADEPITIVAPVYARDDLTPRILDGLYLSEEDSGRYRSVTVGYRLSETGIAGKAAEIVSASRDSQLIVFGFTTDDHVSVLRRVIEGTGGRTPIVAIAFNDPGKLDAASIEQITYVASYSNIDVSNEAVVQALLGDRPLKDRIYLPVQIAGFQHNVSSAPFAQRVYSCVESIEESRRIFRDASVGIEKALAEREIEQAEDHMHDAIRLLRVFNSACGGVRTDEELANAQAELDAADQAVREFQGQLDALRQR